MKEFMPITGHFFLRNQGDKTMMIGVLGETETLWADGEIWVVSLILADCKKYYPPKYLKGKRADQILCTSVKFNDLKEIK